MKSQRLLLLAIPLLALVYFMLPRKISELPAALQTEDESPKRTAPVEQSTTKAPFSQPSRSARQEAAEDGPHSVGPESTQTASIGESRSPVADSDVTVASPSGSQQLPLARTDPLEGLSFAEVNEVFSKSASLSDHPDLLAALNQNFSGMIADSNGAKRFADFSLSVQITPPQNETQVLFELTEVNGGHGRFDSKDSSPDKVFKVFQQNAIKIIILGLGQQWFIELQLSDGTEPKARGKFIRADGYVGTLHFN